MIGKDREVTGKKHLLRAARCLAPMTIPASARDWTAFYDGAGIGTIKVDTSVDGVKESDSAYGIHAGYRYDAGQWVVGSEFEHDWTDVKLVPGAMTVDRVMRLKATSGYDFGQALVYVAAGA